MAGGLHTIGLTGKDPDMLCKTNHGNSVCGITALGTGNFVTRHP